MDARGREETSFYARTEARVGMIEDLGFTTRVVASAGGVVDRHGFLPKKWYDLTSHYGDERELVTLIEALKHRGVDAICDVVVNHKSPVFADGRFVSFADETSRSGRRLDWGEFAIVGDHPVFPGKGGDDSGDTIDIAPDLDHSNEEIREAIVEWLNWLKEDIGFSGYRFDYVRGYASEYAREYVLRTVGLEAFCVAENWVGMCWSDDYLLYNQDKPRRALVDWLQGSGDCAALFDFPTKGILQEAVKRGEFWRLADSRAPARLSGWAPHRRRCSSRTTTRRGSGRSRGTDSDWDTRTRSRIPGYRSCSLHISGAIGARSRIGCEDFARRFARFSTFVNARACVARAFWTLRSRSGIFTSPLRMTPSP